MGLHYTPDLMLAEDHPIDPKAVETAFDTLVDLDLLRYDFHRGGITLSDLGHATLLGSIHDKEES